MNGRRLFESRRDYAIRCGLPLLSFDAFIKCYERDHHRFSIENGILYVFGWDMGCKKVVFETRKDQRRYRRWLKVQDRLNRERKFNENMAWLNRVCGGVLFDDEGGLKE